MSKTHWKKTFNKDYLGAHDLDEGQELQLTIQRVAVVDVKDPQGAAKKCNVAYFKQGGKPMIFNVTACKQLKKFSGSNYMEDWPGISIQVYVDPHVKAFVEVTEALRIRDQQPRMTKPVLEPGHKKWAEAVAHFDMKQSLEGITKRYELTPENQQRLLDDAKKLSQPKPE